MHPLASWLAAFAARWRARDPGRAAALAVDDCLALDPRRRLCLIRCGTRQVLLLTGGAQDVVVGWLPEPPSVPGREPLS